LYSFVANRLEDPHLFLAGFENIGALTVEPLAEELHSCSAILDCQWRSVQAVKFHQGIFQSTPGHISVSILESEVYKFTGWK